MADKPNKSPAPLPLTVGEIVAFRPPANLAGWKLTPDTLGGYSYRAEINGVLYIAIPKEWEGRTVAPNTVATAQIGENFGLDLKEMPHFAGDSFRTNSGTFRPDGAENVVLNTGTAVPPADGACAPPSMPGAYDSYLLPAAIIVGALVYFFTKRKV